MGRPKHGWKLRGRAGRPYSVRFSLSGKQVELGTGCTDRAAAERRAEELYSDAVRGARRVVRRSPARGQSLKEVSLAWLADTPEIHDRTRALFATYAESHWAPFWSSAEAITEPSLGEYMRRRLRKVQAQTVRKELSALRRFLRWCVETSRLHAAPSVPSVPVKALGTPHKQRRKGPPVEFTPAEARKLLAKLPAKGREGYPVRARFVFSYETGLRPGTVEALSVPEHWTPGSKELHIPPELDKVRNGRPLPLTPKALQALETAAPRAGVIFGTIDLRDTLRQAAVAVLGEERGSRFTAHYFRHNRITHLAESSDNLVGVMYLAGHKRADTTSRYIKPSMRAARAVLGTVRRRPRG